MFAVVAPVLFQVLQEVLHHALDQRIFTGEMVVKSAVVYACGLGHLPYSKTFQAVVGDEPVRYFDDFAFAVERSASPGSSGGARITIHRISLAQMGIFCQPVDRIRAPPAWTQAAVPDIGIDLRSEYDAIHPAVRWVDGGHWRCTDRCSPAHSYAEIFPKSNLHVGCDFERFSEVMRSFWRH